MKRCHLLRVEADAAAFATLVAALRESGVRAGWLDLGDPEGDPPAADPGLSEAAAGGVLRAVAVAGGRAVSVKPLAGAPVLGDLVREHFLGCRVVLVRGVVEAPLVTPEGDGWRVVTPAGSRLLTTAELVRAAGRARPFGRSDGTA